MPNRESLEGSIKKVYMYMVSKKEPLGIREIARDLGMPVSTVHYAVKKLMKTGIVKKTDNGYIVDKIIDIDGYIALYRKYIPLSFVYAAFFTGISIGETIVAFLNGLNPDRILVVLVSLIATIIFIHDGIRKTRTQ